MGTGRGEVLGAMETDERDQPRPEFPKPPTGSDV